MSNSTTSIAELPQNNGTSQPVVQSMQTNQMIYEPEQRAPVSTQQISNEFYGNVSAQPQYPQNQGGVGDDQLNYQPINAHPNPYGNQQTAPEGLPLPEASPQRNQQQKKSPIIHSRKINHNVQKVVVNRGEVAVKANEISHRDPQRESKNYIVGNIWNSNMMSGESLTKRMSKMNTAQTY